MKNPCLFLFNCIFASVLFAEDGPVYHVPIHGTIDMGLPHYIQRVVDEAAEHNAQAIIFDIDTFGGRVDAATQIKDIILDSKVTTIAFINKRAISAGALISLSCDSIFMTPGASIGAATAVAAPMEAPGVIKIESQLREIKAPAEMARLLIKAMVVTLLSKMMSLICVAASTLPPKVSISNMMALALFVSASFTTR